MKILVTGATGFVGFHLCQKLVSEGHTVFGLIRSPKKAADLNQKVQLIRGELATLNPNVWITDLPEDLDAVIHTAGIVHSFNTETFYEINRDATKVLVNDLKAEYRSLTFVFISSLAAVGPGIKNEISDLTPVSDYGKSKKEAEEILFRILPPEWSRVIIRPPMVIGPRDPAFLDIFKMCKSGVIPTVNTYGIDPKYSFISVDDLVNGIILATTKKHTNLETYFLAHLEQITFSKIIETVSNSLACKKPRLIKLPLKTISLFSKALKVMNKYFGTESRLTPDKINEIAATEWLITSSKAKVELQFSAIDNFESCVAKAAEYYKESKQI